jgi:hypothetical protein
VNSLYRNKVTHEQISLAVSTPFGKQRDEGRTTEVRPPVASGTSLPDTATTREYLNDKVLGIYWRRKSKGRVEGDKGGEKGEGRREGGIAFHIYLRKAEG